MFKLDIVIIYLFSSFFYRWRSSFVLVKLVLELFNNSIIVTDSSCLKFRLLILQDWGVVILVNNQILVVWRLHCGHYSSTGSHSECLRQLTALINSYYWSLGHCMKFISVHKNRVRPWTRRSLLLFETFLVSVSHLSILKVTKIFSGREHRVHLIVNPIACILSDTWWSNLSYGTIFSCLFLEIKLLSVWTCL